MALQHPQPVLPPPPPPIILLVEDDLDTRDMYHLALEGDGFWVVDAPNAASALDSAGDVHPDLIVTDLGLPGDQDGVAFVEKLRENVRTADIPVIAVTGRDPERLGESARLFSEILLKPVLPDFLIGRVRLSLAQARELKVRSARARDRVQVLRERSDRALANSRRIFSLRAEQVYSRACPTCGDMLAWAERRQLFGVTFDYYRPCPSGCGLFCYNHAERSLVPLAS
jgi:DNA-binding response OmpR family regulator